MRPDSTSPGDAQTFSSLSIEDYNIGTPATPSFSSSTLCSEERRQEKDESSRFFDRRRRRRTASSSAVEDDDGSIRWLGEPYRLVLFMMAAVATLISAILRRNRRPSSSVSSSSDNISMKNLEVLDSNGNNKADNKHNDVEISSDLYSSTRQQINNNESSSSRQHINFTNSNDEQKQHSKSSTKSSRRFPALFQFSRAMLLVVFALVASFLPTADAYVTVSSKGELSLLGTLSIDPPQDVQPYLAFRFNGIRQWRFAMAPGQAEGDPYLGALQIIQEDETSPKIYMTFMQDQQIDVNAKMEVSGDVTLESGLEVKQDSILAGKTIIGTEQLATDILPNTVVSSMLSVAQDTFFGQTLSVRQQTRLGASLSLTGKGFFGDGLSVRNFVQFGERLSVVDFVSFGSSIEKKTV